MVKIRIQAAYPGVLFAIAMAAIAYGLNKFVPFLHVVSPLLLAILLGVAVRNLHLLPEKCEVGMKFSAKTILRIGVVILGLGISIPQVLNLGVGPIVVIAFSVIAVYVVTIGLGKLLKVAHTTRVLTATGTAICGAAAVAGMSAVVLQHEDDEDVEDASATAVACVTLFGTLMMFILPLACKALSLTPMQSGVWMGTAIHEVGQVVAGAKSMGQEVITNVATVTKLGRVALIAPLVAVVGYVEARSRLAEKARIARETALAHHSDSELAAANARSTTPILPLFVVGFLVLVLVRSALGWMGLDAQLGTVYSVVKELASFILTLAMGAMGAGVNLRIIAATGLRAIGLGFIAGIVAALASLGLVLLLV